VFLPVAVAVLIVSAIRLAIALTEHA